uniref:Uncharacterized protein n=1 Tax=Acrobeloides nanus TaxID=290746 RepID=A0A914DRP4_9BILA
MNSQVRRLLQLLIVAIFVSLIASASLGRPDKKAMRNSLVRFGKRSNYFGNSGFPVFADEFGYDPEIQRLYLSRLFQDNQ